MTTIRGYMNQTRQCTQSTISIMDNMHLIFDYAYFATADTTAIIYTNKTGKFSIQSSEEYKYVMICYAYSCNAILATPSKTDLPMNYYRHISISAPSFIMLAYHYTFTKWTMKHTLISNISLPPKMQLSHMFLRIITIPMQQRKQFKLGKIILSTVLPVSPKDFPIAYWCWLIDQDIVTQCSRPNHICLQSLPWPLSLPVNTYGTNRNNMFGTHQT